MAKVVCIGDSLTEGDYGVFGKSGIANVQKENYPYFLGKMTGWEVVNLGKCGYRASDSLPYVQERAEVLRDADYIVVLLGTNGGQSATKETIDNAAYERLIDLCQKEAPGARLFLCTPPHATENPAMSNCGYAPQVAEAMRFVRNTAQRRKLPLIELDKCPDFTAEAETAMQPNDGLHFSTVGYERLARFVREAIG